jgi:hypothetical protein
LNFQDFGSSRQKEKSIIAALENVKTIETGHLRKYALIKRETDFNLYDFSTKIRENFVCDFERTKSV